MTDVAAEDTNPETASQYKGDTPMAELDGRADSGGRQAIAHNRNHSQRPNRSNSHNSHHYNKQQKKRASPNPQEAIGIRMESNGLPQV